MSPETNNAEEYLSVLQFAARVGVIPMTVYEWMKEGHPVHGPIRHRRRTRAFEIPVSEADRIMADIVPAAENG